MFLIKKIFLKWVSLIRPLNFADKLLRLLETAQNNCRTRLRCVKEMVKEERRKKREREREKSAKNRGQGCKEKVEDKISLTIYYVGCQLGTGCPRNEFIKYFIRAGRRESRNRRCRNRGMGMEQQVPKRERTELYKRTPFL